MSRRAAEVLDQCNMVAGYTKYIDLIRDLIPGKQIVSAGMTREVDRVEAAIQTALQGKSCAIVSSGDPGIYALAGLVFEICREKKIPMVSHRKDADSTGLLVEVVPGIPAPSSGGALLGAPLMHDFAVISLSDLLTPWETIEKRLQAAAEADVNMLTTVFIGNSNTFTHDGFMITPRGYADKYDLK
jgi:precorrin-3B C17-methyltransferase